MWSVLRHLPVQRGGETAPSVDGGTDGVGGRVTGGAAKPERREEKQNNPISWRTTRTSVGWSRKMMSEKRVVGGVFFFLVFWVRFFGVFFGDKIGDFLIANVRMLNVDKTFGHI